MSDTFKDMKNLQIVSAKNTLEKSNDNWYCEFQETYMWFGNL